MQIIVEFSTDMLNLPISYHSILHGFIFNTLSKGSPAYSEFLHNKGEDCNRNLTKLFTFSYLQGKYIIKGLNIIFPTTATLEIRSYDTEFIQAFLKGCVIGSQVKLGHNYAIISNCKLSNKFITTNTIDVHTKTPFVVHTTFEQRKIFDNELIKYKLIKNANEKWLLLGKNADDFALDIKWHQVEPKPVHCVFKNINISGWDTQFTLNGNIDVLNLLYNAGIGAKNSQGFGMLEII